MSDESVPLWKREFPDYPAEAFPPIPEGFEDSSWHNCVCPSLTSDRYGMTIWLDYPDESMREFPGMRRFLVEAQTDGVETGRWHERADSWEAVLAIIERRKPC